jgi:ketosteroid isomerase-like protein
MGCEQGFSPARRAHAEQAVRGQVETWTLAVNNRSLDTLGLLYHNGPELSVVTADGRITRGWDEVSAGLGAWAASAPRFNFLVHDIAVDIVSREVAVSAFRTTLDIEIGGTRREIPGRGTLVWARDADGEPWRIRAEHQSVQVAGENR